MAVRIGVSEPIDFGERHPLDDVESAGGAVVEVAGRLLAIEPVEDLPGGIAQPEEGRPIGRHEKPLVVRDGQPRRVGGDRVAGGQRTDAAEQRYQREARRAGRGGRETMADGHLWGHHGEQAPASGVTRAKTT